MRTLIACCALALGACSDPDFSGLYRLDIYLVDSTGCGPGVTPAGPPPYFQVKQDNLFGVRFASVETCTSNDPATCTGSGGVSPGFDIASGTASSCTMEHVEASIGGDDTSVTFEQKIYGVRDQMVSACTAKEAGDRGTSMPCIGHMTITGTRL